MSGMEFMLVLAAVLVVGFALAWWWSGRSKGHRVEHTSETDRGRAEATFQHHLNQNAPFGQGPG